jgi:predicted nuclease with TOPRIM domain
MAFDPLTIRKHAEKFSIARFRTEFRDKIHELWNEHAKLHEKLEELEEMVDS